MGFYSPHLAAFGALLAFGSICGLLAIVLPALLIPIPKFRDRRIARRPTGAGRDAANGRTRDMPGRDAGKSSD